MADIELVIKMPEERYRHIMRMQFYTPRGSLIEEMLTTIRHGTPLPKGHGDLIDKKEAIISLFDYYSGKKTVGQCIDDVQTIIEADTESEAQDADSY